MTFQKGEVILVLFPFSEKNAVKLRPALVLNVSGKLITVAQITSTNRSDKLRGIWVEKESHLGRAMKILQDSFINLENIIDITESYINRKLGKFSEFERIEKLLT
ncbi:MAG: type II toxin-antitoxin system PemK/MazF family toxin [Chlorobi bacterium]|nr:type II toxin-antitoxin system PemK/MazF family toxin [Chlorobiota bacterium]